MLRHLFSLSIWCAGAVVLQAAPALFWADTSLVASAQKSFTLEKGKKQWQIPLKIEKGARLNTTSGYCLVFEPVSAHALPEGAYEVHLTATSAFSEKTASPDAPSFVGLLNLFGVSESSRPVLFLDVAAHLHTIATSGTTLGDCLFVNILFRGNTLPSGEEVEHNGSLSVGNAQLLEVR